MSTDRFQKLMRQNYKVSLESAKKTLAMIQENEKDQDLEAINSAIASLESVITKL